MTLLYQPFENVYRVYCLCRTFPKYNTKKYKKNKKTQRTTCGTVAGIKSVLMLDANVTGSKEVSTDLLR